MAKNTLYADELRRGMRIALERKGIDPTSTKELDRLCRQMGMGRRFLIQWLIEEKVASPRGTNVKAVMDYLQLTESQVMEYACGGEVVNLPLKGPKPLIPLQNSFARSNVREYDVRADTPREDAKMVSLVSDRPVIAERSVPTSLIDRLHPNAQPGIVRIQGDAMAPTFPHGTPLLIDMSVRYPSPTGCFVLWDGAGYIVQRCQILLGSNPLRVRVTSDNHHDYAAQEMLVADCPVVGMVIAELDPVTWNERQAA